MGRVFIGGSLDCPFRRIDEILENHLQDVDFVFLDFHAETTSEKLAMAFHVDGRVHMMVGTHTHVQTADARIMPSGMGYITDAGMCGPLDSVIGVDAKMIVDRFITGLPTKFATAKGPVQINGVLFELSTEVGVVKAVERVYRTYG
jgi:calcineurin-like phosphoesterase